MVVDYEMAWVKLQALIASKSQHGREQTLMAMADIVQECRVPPGELSRLLRLYGVEVERTRAIEAETDRDVLGPFTGGSASPVDSELPEHHRTEEVHDGSSNGRPGAGAGAGAGRLAAV